MNSTPRYIRKGATMIGYRQECAGGITQIRDSHHRLLGWYDSNNDTTRNSGGGYYANGDATGDLLPRS